jgi:hypothetical protein
VRERRAAQQRFQVAVCWSVRRVRRWWAPRRYHEVPDPAGGTAVAAKRYAYDAEGKQTLLTDANGLFTATVYTKDELVATVTTTPGAVTDVSSMPAMQTQIHSSATISHWRGSIMFPTIS